MLRSLNPAWAFAGLLALAGAMPPARAQNAAGDPRLPAALPAKAALPAQLAAQPPADNLLDTIHAEEQRGTYVFYTQSYIDTLNRHASYSGDVYGALQSMEVDGCKIEAKVALFDHFSGQAGKQIYHDSQDAALYSVGFTLSAAIARSLTVTEARPVQLGAATHSVCKDNPTCSFAWLTIRAGPAAIQETDTLNDLEVFRGAVSQFQIPLSSDETGRRLMAELRALAQVQCK